jgi:hypothetical protein
MMFVLGFVVASTLTIAALLGLAVAIRICLDSAATVFKIGVTHHFKLHRSLIAEIHELIKKLPESMPHSGVGRRGRGGADSDDDYDRNDDNDDDDDEYKNDDDDVPKNASTNGAKRRMPMALLNRSASPSPSPRRSRRSRSHRALASPCSMPGSSSDPMPLVDREIDGTDSEGGGESVPLKDFMES